MPPGPPPAPTQWKRFGLRCVEISREVADTEGYREGAGVVVTEVRTGGPAAEIGIRTGDLVQGLGPRQVKSLEDVLLVVQYAKPGTSRKVSLGRPRRTRRGVQLQRLDGRLVAE